MGELPSPRIMMDTISLTHPASVSNLNVAEVHHRLHRLIIRMLRTSPTARATTFRRIVSRLTACPEYTLAMAD